MARTADVVIIGGGVIGCSIAYELAKRGVGCVVLEKERIGWAASGATAGIIGPLWYVDRAIGPYFKLGMRSLEMFPTLAAELKDAGVDPEFRQAGILKPALTEELYSTLHENLPWQQGLGLGVEWLSREAILDREPELTPAVLAAEIGAPGFLALHPDGDKLYAAASFAGGPGPAGVGNSDPLPKT